MLRCGFNLVQTLKALGKSIKFVQVMQKKPLRLIFHMQCLSSQLLRIRNLGVTQLGFCDSKSLTTQGSRWHLELLLSQGSILQKILLHAHSRVYFQACSLYWLLVTALLSGISFSLLRATTHSSFLQFGVSRMQ